MTKQHTIDQLSRRNELQTQCIQDLRARHDKAINALGQLSRGLGRDWSGRTTDWHHCMQKLAAEELADIAKLPLRQTS